eukprot:jgi/Phyca11/125162/e_gw1.57.247.1
MLRWYLTSSQHPTRSQFFDHQQKAEQYEECEAFIKSQFLEMTAKMDFDRHLHPEQTDGHNCGSLVLLFFECSVRGIALPKTVSNSLMRYFRLRYLLKSLHV